MTTTRLECCLPDCSWSYEIPAPTVPPEGGDFDELVARVSARQHARAEAAAVAHLERHDVVEFAAEIQRLNTELAEWRRLGKLLETAASDEASTLDGTPSP